MCLRWPMAGSNMSPPLAVMAVVVLSVLLEGSSHAAPEMDPYKILGVTRSASQAEIKKVYKRLAKEWWVFFPKMLSLSLDSSQVVSNELVLLKASWQKQRSRCWGHVHQDHKVLWGLSVYVYTLSFQEARISCTFFKTFSFNSYTGFPNMGIILVQLFNIIYIFKTFSLSQTIDCTVWHL